MTYTLTTPTGTVAGELQPGGGGALEVRHRNGTPADSWGSGAQRGAPVCFSTWRVDAPDGYCLLYGDTFGASQVGPSSFVLADPGMWKLPARRNGVDLWPGTDSWHRILPGDTLYARLVPSLDPWEVGYIQERLTPQRRSKALEVMAFDEARLARWPWLRKVLGWYTVDASSFDRTTPVGQRNCGWLLFPKNFMTRWSFYLGSYEAGIAACEHWYGLGTRSAVQGENQTNEHYRVAACWLGRGIRDGDAVAVSTGLYLLRHKVAYGLVDCDDTSHIDYGKWRNEKGDVARGTTGTRPNRPKEYDRDLALAWAAGFCETEPMLERAAQIRQGSLLGPAWAWNGAGGARGLGHYLENLRDWYIATGDARFRTRAAVEITHAMQIVGSLPYFDENVGTHHVSGGEGLCALAMCRWWVARGAGAMWQSKLDSMLQWYESHLTDAQGNTAYYANVDPAGNAIWQANAEFGSLNWLHVPGLSQTIRDRIEAHLFTKYANTATCDAAFGGEGPGWEKFVPWIVGWGATSE